MKKTSLMGASVVAATLLAVAPIAAPAISSVSGTQVVQAATDEHQAQVDQLFNTFGTTNKTVQIAAANNPGKGEMNATDAGNVLKNVAAINGSTLSQANDVTTGKPKDGLFQTSGQLTTSQLFLRQFQTYYPVQFDMDGINGYKVEAVVSAGTGQQLNSSDEINSKADEIVQNGGSMTVNMTVKNDKNETVTTKALTFNVKPLASAASVDSLYVTAPTDFSVKAGTAVSDYNYGYTVNGVTAVDQHGAAANGYDFSNGKNITATVQRGTTPVDDNGDVNGSTTWANATDTFNTKPAEGQKEKIAYRQAVTLQLPADSKLTTVNINNKNYTVKDNKVTFYRNIDVTGQVAGTPVDSKLDKLNGVVTVKTTDDYVALYNKNGELIPGRAVMPNTQWFTNGKLTILGTGKVFYKVAPNEYVPADQVSFVDNGTANTGSVTTSKEKGVFTVKDDDVTNLLYALKGDKFETVPGRAAARGAQFRYDKKATLGGYTYYKIAPNEWIVSSSGSAQPDAQ